MRDAEGRKKEASKIIYKQQGKATQHTQGSALVYFKSNNKTCMYITKAYVKERRRGKGEERMQAGRGTNNKARQTEHDPRGDTFPGGDIVEEIREEDVQGGGAGKEEAGMEETGEEETGRKGRQGGGDREEETGRRSREEETGRRSRILSESQGL